MVKQFKLSLRCLLTNQLSVTDFRCVIMEIAATINDRPLGRFRTDESILTPNQLLLGRNHTSMPPLLTAHEDSLIGLQQYVKEVYKSWWERWEVNVLPNLFENKKWIHSKANLNIGDICLIHLTKGKHAPQGYKYAKVIELCPSTDGLVRKVKVTYYNVPSLKAKVMEIDVRRLTVLPDASNITSQCVAATKLRDDPDEVEDDSTASAGGADGYSSAVHTVLEDVSLPASIVEI